MSWKDLIEQTRKITEKSKPIMKQAQMYGSHTLAFLGKQVEQTPIYIKTEEEYNIHSSEKRSICIAYDSTKEVAEFIHIMMPVWATKAWTDAATLKYIEVSNNPDLARNLNISGPIDMRINYMGEEQYRFQTLEEIKAWWKNRIYIQNTPGVPPSNHETKDIEQDPLKTILSETKSP